MKNRFAPLACVLLAHGLLAGGAAGARDQINVVGSSTVYPFSTVVAEQFGRSGKFKTPKVEATGSGGGLKLFCAGVGMNTPDVANASRRIKQKEVDKCRKNGVTDVVEVRIGYDGIVLAGSKQAPQMKLTLKQIYLALAKDVPNPDGSESFVPNPYKKWSDVGASLPASSIEVLGPPPTSGTRDAFVELALEGGCKQFAWVKAMKKTDKREYKARCHTIREDGAYIEAGENDNLIVQKLLVNSNARGVFGFSFLDQNLDTMRAATVDDVAPTFDAIASGEYPVARTLYFYVKKAHVGKVPGLAEYVDEFISDAASGAEGYLTDKGMIPLSDAERKRLLPAVRQMQTLGMKL